MKPFNLELAKAGHPIQTKDGRPARIICFDRKYSKYPIVALIDHHESGIELVYSYTLEGKCAHFPEFNLFMTQVKKEAWIHIHRCSDGTILSGKIYLHKEMAEEAQTDNMFTARLEWEE